MFQQATYVPTLAVRPSEMNGLEFLPGIAKDKIIPCFLLAPWANSNSLDRTIARIERAFNKRPYFLDIDNDYQNSNDPGAPQRELEELKKPTNSYENWINFVNRHQNIYPCLQSRGLDQLEIENQIKKLQSIDRRFCLRIIKKTIPDNLPELVRALANTGTSDFAIILEGRWTSDPLSLASWLIGVINEGLNKIEANIPIIVSCTSIPTNFTPFSGNEPRTVFFKNRALMEEVKRSTNRRRIFYGDWGSTRPRERSGYANRPIDRIDYPTVSSWLIARKKEDGWSFREAAKQITSSTAWDGNLGIWGEDMIKNTLINEALGIDTAQKNIASRVNIHLYRQALYGITPPSPDQLDEDWED